MDKVISEPRLVGGDPLTENPASFTRFLLPVGLRPQRVNQNASAADIAGRWRWEKSSARDWCHAPKVGLGDSTKHLDRARRRHVTPETASTLYDRAKWLILRPPTGGEATSASASPVTLGEGDDAIAVHLRAPALVCFEWATEGPAAEEFRLPTAHLSVGMLVVEAWFEGNPLLDQVLRFNEAFRYWLEPWSGHFSGSSYGSFLRNLPVALRDTPGGAERLENLPEEAQSVKGYFERWASLVETDVFLSCGDRRHHWVLCGADPDMQDCWNEQARAFAAGTMPKSGLPKDRGWAIHADERAFTITCAILGFGTDTLTKQVVEFASSAVLGPKTGRWVRLLNVDAPEGEEAHEYEREWAEDRTYRRWAHYGTLYGFSYHSAAMMSGACSSPPTWLHFHQIYADQALLLLYVRTVLFRFRRKLSQHAAGLCDTLKGGRRAPAEMERFRDDFSRLRAEFDLFTDIYQFPTLSNQQQAVEMYGLFRSQMDLDALYEEVEKEIKSTEALVDEMIQRDWGRIGLALSLAGVVGIPAAIAIDVLVDGWDSTALRVVVIILMLATMGAGLWLLLRARWFRHSRRGLKG